MQFAHARERERLDGDYIGQTIDRVFSWTKKNPTGGERGAETLAAASARRAK